MFSLGLQEWNWRKRRWWKEFAARAAPCLLICARYESVRGREERKNSVDLINWTMFVYTLMFNLKIIKKTKISKKSNLKSRKEKDEGRCFAGLGRWKEGRWITRNDGWFSFACIRLGNLSITKLSRSPSRINKDTLITVQKSKKDKAKERRYCTHVCVCVCVITQSTHDTTKHLTLN